MNWIIANLSGILVVWLIVEQIIANIPSLKANSTLQVVCNIVDTILNALKGQKGGTQATTTTTITAPPTDPSITK